MGASRRQQKRRKERVAPEGRKSSEVDFCDVPESVTVVSAWPGGSLRAQQNKSGREYKPISHFIAGLVSVNLRSGTKVVKWCAASAPGHGELYLVHAGSEEAESEYFRRTGDRRHARQLFRP